MNIKRFLFPSLLVGAVLALILRTLPKRVSAKPVTNSASYDAIDAYVEGQMRRLHMPGVSLAIVEGGKIVHLRGFGQAHPGGKVPAPQTPFIIGSLTKSVTAARPGLHLRIRTGCDTLSATYRPPDGARLT